MPTNQLETSFSVTTAAMAQSHVIHSGYVNELLGSIHTQEKAEAKTRRSDQRIDDELQRNFSLSLVISFRVNEP